MYFVTQYYQASVPMALMAAYPAHPWQPWKFSRLYSAWWTKQSNLQQFFDWAAIELKVGNLSGWYTIEKRAILKKQGPHVFAALFPL